MTSDASCPLLAEKLQGSITMADLRQLPGAGKVGCMKEPGAQFRLAVDKSWLALQ